jgi:hypothetical protein
MIHSLDRDVIAQARVISRSRVRPPLWPVISILVAKISGGTPLYVGNSLPPPVARRDIDLLAIAGPRAT